MLMACYNAERWLVAALESVIEQSFYDIEILVVNDGSSDGTSEILRFYAEKDSRIIVIDKKNTGLADSLNCGIGVARGRWIARLDADDVCERRRLEKQQAYVSTHPGTVLLGSGSIEIDEVGTPRRVCKYPQGHRGLVSRLEKWGGFFPHSSALFRLDVVQAMGGYRSELLRAEDWDLWLRLAERGKLACLPEPLVRIRRHGTQISRDAGGRQSRIDACAATVSHFVRRVGLADPIEPGNREATQQFLKWVEQRMEDAKVFEKRRIWEDVRSSFFNSSNRVSAWMDAIWKIARSRYGYSLLRDWVLGSRLERRLAKEWRVVSARVEQGDRKSIWDCR